jgi:Kdo2-lipid IVA lauroyltransferase/acyltransferase
VAVPKRRAFRGRLLLGLITLISAVGRRLPLSTGRAFGRALGSLAWHVARRERRKALDNIAAALPELSDAERRRIIRDMFRHLGMTLFEIGWLPNVTLENRSATSTIEGLDRLNDLVAQGKSVVTFTGHCGNWEWLAWCTGLELPVTALQRERSEEGLNRFITDLRSRVGIRTIDRGSAGAARELIQALRKPGVLAFLIDQNIRAESAKVPFFGRPALTPIGPAKLAIRGGAWIAIGFIERGANGMQRIRFLEPFETKRDDDPIELTARITRHIEEQIRRVPEQWVWMHERWRERPKWEVVP